MATNTKIVEVLSFANAKGLDPTTAPNLLAPENLVSCSNFLPDRGYGALTTALGRGPIPDIGSQITLPGPCNGIGYFQRFNPTTGKPPVYVFAVDVGGVGTLWYIPVDGSAPLTPLSLPETLTAGQETYFAEAGVWLFITNGTDTPLKIDNDLNVTFWGITPPNTAPTLTGATGGGLSYGEAPYYYCVTYGVTKTGVTQPGQESSQGTIAGPFTLTQNSGGGTLTFGSGGGGGFANWPGAGVQPLPQTYPFRFILVLNGSNYTYGEPYNADSGGSDSLNASQLASNINAAPGQAYTTPGGKSGVITVTATIDSGNDKQLDLSFSDSTGDAFAITNFVQYAATDNQAPGGPYVGPQIGSPGTASGATTDSAIALSAIPVSSDPQVDERNIYRLGGGLGQWRLVTTLNDNTTTTYTDTTADDDLTGQALVVFRDAPPPFAFICAHQQRIFGFNTLNGPGGRSTARNNSSSLWWSNYGEPWGFDELDNILTVGESLEGDPGVGLASLGNVLGINKKEGFYALYGNSDSTFSTGLFKVADTGCVAPRSICAAYGLMGWLSKQGAYYWPGASLPTNASDGLAGQSNIKSVLDNLSVDNMRSTTGFWYGRMLAFSIPSVDTTYIFDPRTMGWWPLPYSLNEVSYNITTDVPVLGARTGANQYIDAWFQYGTDLGNPIIATGVTRVSSDMGGAAAIDWVKELNTLLVDAPAAQAYFSFQITTDPGVNETIWPTLINENAVNLLEGYPRHRRQTAVIQFVDIQLNFQVLTLQPSTIINRMVLYATPNRRLAPETQSDQ